MPIMLSKDAIIATTYVWVLALHHMTQIEVISAVSSFKNVKYYILYPRFRLVTLLSKVSTSHEWSIFVELLLMFRTN